MTYFAVHYLYADDSERIIKLRPVHREWLGSLEDDGKLVASGPYTDGLGGALILIQLSESATINDAEELMNKDPFHQENVLAGRTIRVWNPVKNIFG